MRLRVQAGRARIATTARIVTSCTLLLGGGLVLFKRDFLAPYGSAEGQTVLAIVGAIFALGFWWLSRMSGISSPPRFLTALHHENGGVRCPWGSSSVRASDSASCSCSAASARRGRR